MKRVLNRLTIGFEMAVWTGLVLGLVIAIRPDIGSWMEVKPYIAINGLTRVVWLYSSLITLVVLRFSRRYMHGHHRMGTFFLRCTVFLLAVFGLAATDHMVLLLVSWLMMGWQMASLIGHKAAWPQAQSAGRLARTYFLIGSVFLAGALVVLYRSSGTLAISSSLAAVGQFQPWKIYLIFAAIFLSVMIQSALYPVQGWLMSSMTAPTPASTLMHAGFVNAGGLLLTVFSPLFADRLPLMLLLVVVGGLSAIMGQVWKMVQSIVKRQLACSTVAQMGFMLLQCGLGFFSAAVTHLLLHGFYKGYLFLNVGSSIKQVHPDQQQDGQWSFPSLVEMFVTAVLAGGVFVVLTGKGTSWNSGMFLTFMVVLTVIHGCKEFWDQHVSNAPRYLFSVVAVLTTGIYSLVYLGITTMMSGVPMVTSPTSLTPIHLFLMGVFVGAYLLIEFKFYQNIPWLYVYVLNASQPHSDTILASREEYNV